jgi:tetratricopeptide (TPR) repeat protein
MMSKEVMVTAPLMVLLYDGLFLSGSWREALRRRWIWYVGLLLSVVWLLFLIEQVPGTSGLFGSPTAPDANFRGAYSDRWSYAATMPGVILYYLRLLAWPDPLIFDYKWPVAASWPAILLPGSVIAAGGIATAWGLLRRHAWAYPIAWYLITLSPSSSVIPLYDDYIAEYRVYLPSIGPLVLVLLLAWRCLARTGWARPRRVATGATVGTLVLLTLGGLTYARNIDYRTALSLWSDTVRKAPQNERAHACLGQALYEANRLDEAIEHYREALRLYPDYFEVHVDLGAALMDKGLLNEAMKESEEALRLHPGNASALSNIGIILMNQGRILIDQGRLDDATSRLRESLQIDAQLPPARAQQATAAHAILGSLLARQGRLEEAAHELREALRLNSDLFDTHNDLGVVLAMQGHRKEAEKEFREALRLNPGYADAQRNLNQVMRELASSPDGNH